MHKHCFQFLLGITKAPKENKNSAYAKFGGTNKEYSGIFRSGLFSHEIKSSLRLKKKNPESAHNLEKFFGPNESLCHAEQNGEKNFVFGQNWNFL